jgi:RNA polymerase primary sigma factor
MTTEQINLATARIQSLAEGDPKRVRLVNRVVERNLRLVIFSVKGYLSGGPSGRKWGCHETVDFLQVGALGLLRAAELYDPARGYTFSTYANYWIRSKVIRYGIKTRGIVHVSESMARNVISYRKNGFLKSRKTGQRIPDEKTAPLVREAEAALLCGSLNVVNEFGYEIMEAIPDAPRSAADPDLADALDVAMDAAGVEPLGKEILMLLYGHNYSRQEVGDMLGISQGVLKTQRKIALDKVKGDQRLAALV